MALVGLVIFNINALSDRGWRRSGSDCLDEKSVAELDVCCGVSDDNREREPVTVGHGISVPSAIDLNQNICA